ncbi:SMP-30/gluconolactonase/LRE family protein [Candidatus Kirkpatrickella diaphorinae]|uniref:SMP-30/gluconolactonase/LRE family protein n=1 Tax=Candidatus Kirkpatrickella diaphorinae TaxID=2984322 RepID=A0ABY6GHH0_9PROT|nr:SMP-30/gluconolactonase/LRE family protein [Candidatus Kirkpatrickella diaphorinae]UYH50496.1 SMP-30/gluconolactonase/LRE family protein [Candidatus Kirkpatrickella diaphorinae]
MDSQLAVPQLHCTTALRTQLGEGPIWVAEREALYFVDIVNKNLHRLRPRHNALKTWATPLRPVFVVPTDAGSLLVGMEDGLYFFDETEGDFTCIQPIPMADGDRTRLNDACVDAEGRLWFGTMDEEEKEGKGILFCFKAVPGGYAVSQHDDDFIVTNGPSVTSDGRTLYVSDTPRGVIYRHSLSPDGALSDKTVFAKFDDGEGGPDGVVCDADGNLWASSWGGSKIIVFRPDGSRRLELSVPSPNMTKVAFTGPKLSTVYATSARQNLSEESLAQYPEAGGLFSGETPFRGIETRLFRCLAA